MPFKRIWTIHPSVKELWANPKMIPKLQLFFDHLLANVPAPGNFTRDEIMRKAAAAEFKVFGSPLNNLLGPNTKVFSPERLKEITTRLRGVQASVEKVADAKTTYGIDFTAPVGTRVIRETEKAIELQIEPVSLEMANRSKLKAGALYLPHETDPETAYVAKPFKEGDKRPPVYAYLRLIPFRDAASNELSYFVQNLQPRKDNHAANQLQKTYRFLGKWGLMVALNYAFSTGATNVFVSSEYARKTHGEFGDHHQAHIARVVAKRGVPAEVKTAWADFQAGKTTKDAFTEVARQNAVHLPRHLTGEEAERLYNRSALEMGFQPFASYITVKEPGKKVTKISRPLVYKASEGHPLFFLSHKPFRHTEQ